MEKFFDDISKIRPEYLLKATPYTKVPRVNFDYKLSKEEFFAHLYAPRSNRSEYKRENDDFDKDIDDELRDLGNKFAKVSVLNITGYAGSGKTTYLHHLLWTMKNSIGKYEVVDYEGHKKALAPFIERTASLLSVYNDITELCDYFDIVAKNYLFNAYRFEEHLARLSKLSAALRTSENKESAYRNVIQAFSKSTNKDAAFLSFLFFVDLLLLLYDRFINPNQISMILVIDNSDSLSNLAQESLLLTSLNDFTNDCTYFFAANLKNDSMYLEREIKDVFQNTKLLVFITTRMATKNRYESLDPDNETIDGWRSLQLPANYYDHRDILKTRIDYYTGPFSNGGNKTVEELILVSKLANVAYQNLKFMRLFNGNVRSCVERLCNIVSSFPESELNEFLALSAESHDNPTASEGAEGYFLNMLLDVFKNKQLYENKLCLKPIRKNGNISLSRMILTMLRENGHRYSLFNLFDSLTRLGFDGDDICKTIWHLCEIGRRVWRRLIIFDLIIPRSLKELKKQAAQYYAGETDIEKYSEIIICTSGLTYLEFVVPHFEFMLSRHEMGRDYSRRPKYHPLFASSSEEAIKENNELVYRFEKKIDTVFEDVCYCCASSTKFANRVLQTYGFSRDEYMTETTYNYLPRGSEGKFFTKQSYESRLIFRHIGYIDKYRCYILKKNEDKGPKILADINRRLVERIVKYIKLYQDPEKCYQTKSQDVAAERLYNLAKKIMDSNYYDFATKIQVYRIQDDICYS